MAFKAFWQPLLPGAFLAILGIKKQGQISVLKNLIFNGGSGKSWASGFLGGFLKPLGLLVALASWGFPGNFGDKKAPKPSISVLKIAF